MYILGGVSLIFLHCQIDVNFAIQYARSRSVVLVDVTALCKLSVI